MGAAEPLGWVSRVVSECGTPAITGEHRETNTSGTGNLMPPGPTYTNAVLSVTGMKENTPVLPRPPPTMNMRNSS